MVAAEYVAEFVENYNASVGFSSPYMSFSPLYVVPGTVPARAAADTSFRRSFAACTAHAQQHIPLGVVQHVRQSKKLAPCRRALGWNCSRPNRHCRREPMAA